MMIKQARDVLLDKPPGVLEGPEVGYVRPGGCQRVPSAGLRADPREEGSLLLSKLWRQVSCAMQPLLACHIHPGLEWGRGDVQPV